MIALGGYSRYPIFYDATGIHTLGARSSDNAFDRYTNNLKGRFVAIHHLANLRYRSRFAMESVAINPELQSEEEIPSYLYFYPALTPEATLTNAHTLGISLKGGRQGIYLPLLTLRHLTQEEVNALLHIAKVEALSLDRLKEFLQRLNIQLVEDRELAGNTYVWGLRDPLVGRPYRVRLDAKGRVLNVDFCIDFLHTFYVAELVMLVREQHDINHISGFDY